MNAIQIVLTAVFVLIAVLLIRFTIKSYRIKKVSAEDEGFTVRNSPIYLLVAIVFYIAALGVALLILIKGMIHPAGITVVCILLALGTVLLFRALVFKVAVLPDKIVLTRAYFKKTTLPYANIKSAELNKKNLLLETAGGTFKLSSLVINGELFLKRLEEKGVSVTRAYPERAEEPAAKEAEEEGTD